MNAGHPPGPSTPRPAPRDLLENMSDAFVALDKDWRYTYVNRRAGELFGRRPEDLLGKHIWTEFPEGVGQPFHLAYEKAMADQQPARLEAYYPPYDRWFENIIYPSPDGLAIYFHDITDRKEAEEKLAASEARLRAIIDTEPECVKLLAADGSLLEMNPAGLRMLEADSFAQIGNHCVYPLVVEEHRQAFKELTEKVFAGESGQLEFQIVGLKGGRRWLETHASPLRDAQGRITASLGITRDITARKQAEAALRESETRFALLFQKTPLPTTLARRRDGAFVEVNEAFEKAFGWSRAEALGRTPLELGMHPDAATRTRILGELTPGRSLPEQELTLYTRSGDRRVMLVNVHPVTLGGREYILSTVYDITERKRAETQIALLAAFVNAANDAIIGGDNEQRITFWNAAAERFYGWRRDEVLGRAVADIVPMEIAGQTRRDVQDRVQREGSWRGDVLQRDRQGRPHDVDLRVTLVRDASGAVVGSFGVNHDITARKQAEQKLLEQLDELLRWQNVTLHREDRVQELKREVNELLARLGERPRYRNPEPP